MFQWWNQGWIGRLFWLSWILSFWKFRVTVYWAVPSYSGHGRDLHGSTCEFCLKNRCLAVSRTISSSFCANKHPEEVNCPEKSVSHWARHFSTFWATWWICWFCQGQLLSSHLVSAWIWSMLRGFLHALYQFHRSGYNLTRSNSCVTISGFHATPFEWGCHWAYRGTVSNDSLLLAHLSWRQTRDWQVFPPLLHRLKQMCLTGLSHRRLARLPHSPQRPYYSSWLSSCAQSAAVKKAEVSLSWSWSRSCRGIWGRRCLSELYRLAKVFTLACGLPCPWDQASQDLKRDRWPGHYQFVTSDQSSSRVAGSSQLTPWSDLAH